LNKKAGARETAEIRFVTNLAGFTLKDQSRNAVIRNERNIFYLYKRIQNIRLKWIRHVERMEPKRIPKP
jgi:hypothetical protein